MRREDYTHLLGATLALGVLILIAFQIYINREPVRIQAVRAADRAAAIAAGAELYQANCAGCHGEQGEGVDAPALNNLAVLRDTPDETFFDLTANGVPGTEMPAWLQARGGPFTDEEIRQIVAFIRSWESTAPDLGRQRMRVDAQRGARIYAATCVICHGENGQGGSAPMLNDPARLQQFDDEWYAETIAKGRPAQGMPVWGTVLSPQQIGDLVALIDAWRRGEQIVVGDVASLLKDAAHALEHREIGEAAELLEQAADSAEHEQAEVIEQALAALDAADVKGAEALIEQAQAMAAEMPSPAPSPGEEITTPAATVDPGVQHLRGAVHALEHNELEEAKAVLSEAMELLPPGDLFEAAEHALEDIKAGKPGEARQVLEEALAAAGVPPLEEETPEAEATPTAAANAGVEHLREAVHALEHNELREAKAALREALELLPPGDLLEAAEHALEDIEAGKRDEARDVLEEALEGVGQR